MSSDENLILISWELDIGLMKEIQSFWAVIVAFMKTKTRNIKIYGSMITSIFEKWYGQGLFLDIEGVYY